MHCWVDIYEAATFQTYLTRKIGGTNISHKIPSMFNHDFYSFRNTQCKFGGHHDNPRTIFYPMVTFDSLHELATNYNSVS